jgi:S1-C subfamily serine protease
MRPPRCLSRCVALAAVLALTALPAAGRGDDGIPVKKLVELKAATVFIKVEADKYRASGSGFLVHADGETGYVATNEHVVSLPAKVGGKRTVTLVFHSDSEAEKSVPAEVVAADKEIDLAVLKVTGFKGLPKPLAAGENPKLVETMTVYAFGFPFGQALSVGKGRNPAITIGKGSVSSLRYNDKRELVGVQIDGDLNPGNSGGPVVDALEKIGPPAEKAVVAKLLGHKDNFVRRDACGVLKSIGTKESIPALEAAQKEGNVFVSGPAGEALKVIRERVEKK